MNALRLCYLLVALLVFQTAAALYDSHQDLATATSHVPAHHQDAADGSIHFDELLAESDYSDSIPQIEHIKPDVSQDCSHCCHCHGVSCVCLLSHALSVLNAGNVVLSFGNQSAFVAGVSSSLYRPPIT